MRDLETVSSFTANEENRKKERKNMSDTPKVLNSQMFERKNPIPRSAEHLASLESMNECPSFNFLVFISMKV